MIRADHFLGVLFHAANIGSTTVRRRSPGWAAPIGCMVVCFLTVWFGSATVAVAQLSYVPEQGDSCPECGTPYENEVYDHGPYEQPTLQAFSTQLGGQGPGVACCDPQCRSWKQRLDEYLTPPGRHRGLGHPLQRESWLFRPFGAGWFMGMAQGGRTIKDRIGAGNHFSGGVGMNRGFIGGYRLGWDSSYYWGAELRMSFASIELFDSGAARVAQQQADADLNLDPDHPWLDRFSHRRDASVQQWDINLVYYPWGDSQWRPYFTIGLGANRIRLFDRLDHYFDSYLVAMPLAMGLKYRYNDRVALRFDVADQMAFSGGTAFVAQHTLAITFGVEVRFGGTRKAYWPWNPGRHYW